MLKISPAITVQGVPGVLKGKTNDYILFPDSEDKDLYYALAEYPTFLADKDGNPVFNLTWFYGSGMKSGGICSMAVALPTPDLGIDGVRSMLLEAVTTDSAVRTAAETTLALCKAMEAGDTAKVAQLKAALGFDDTAAEGKKKMYDKTRDWDQFLPDSGKFRVSPIPYKSGTVTVQSFAASAFEGQKPDFDGRFTTTPSLFNSNAAVITCNLNEMGANQFWHALGGWQLDPNGKTPSGYDQAKGSSSVVRVVYDVTFDGLLPEATATVTLSKSLIEKLKVEDVMRRGSWGRTYHEEVVRGKEYNEAINSATKIVLPASASDGDKDNVQKMLTDWAAAQLEDMTKAQFPSIPLDQLNLDNMREFDSKQDQQRTYKLTQAVTLPKHPQNLLPKVNGIVEDEAIKKFFQLIDLNDVPFVNVGLTVSPPSPSYLNERKVDRLVLTQLSYAGQKLLDDAGKDVTSIEFPANANPQPNKTYQGTFGKDTANPSIEYSYLVIYNDGTPSFRAPTASQRDSNFLDLSSVDLGILNVSLSGMSLPWGVISSAQVVLKYGDWDGTVALTRSETPVLFSKAFGKAMDQPLGYQLKLNLIAGAPVVSDLIQVPHMNGKADIALGSPLGNGTNWIQFQLDPGVQKAQLRVEYEFRNSGPARLFSQLIQLDANKDGGSFAWTVPSDADHPSVLRVTKARVTTASGNADLTDLSAGKLDPVARESVITVYADHLDTF